MTKRPKRRATLSEVLASTADVLFPESLGHALIDLDSADCNGDTPLHVLVWRSDAYGVALLIEAGANVNAVGDMSETPLHVAVGQENVPIIEALLNAGARTDIRSEFNETPLERAAKMGGETARLFASRKLSR